MSSDISCCQNQNNNLIIYRGNNKILFEDEKLLCFQCIILIQNQFSNLIISARHIQILLRENILLCLRCNGLSCEVTFWYVTFNLSYRGLYYMPAILFYLLYNYYILLIKNLSTAFWIRKIELGWPALRSILRIQKVRSA